MWALLKICSHFDYFCEIFLTIFWQTYKKVPKCEQMWAIFISQKIGSSFFFCFSSIYYVSKKITMMLNLLMIGALLHLFHPILKVLMFFQNCVRPFHNNQAKKLLQLACFFHVRMLSHPFHLKQAVNWETLLNLFLRHPPLKLLIWVHAQN